MKNKDVTFSTLVDKLNELYGHTYLNDVLVDPDYITKEGTSLKLIPPASSKAERTG